MGTCGDKGYRQGHYGEDCGSKFCLGNPPVGAICINKRWMKAGAPVSSLPSSPAQVGLPSPPPPRAHPSSLSASPTLPKQAVPPRPLPSTATLPAPYDCNNDYSNWMAKWAEGKKSWCCINKHMDAPRPKTCPLLLPDH